LDMGESISRYFRLIIALIFIWGSLVCNALGKDQKKFRILILHSYHAGLTWTEGEDSGIREVFENRRDIEIFTEYLDSKRIPLNEIMIPFAVFLGQKYSPHYFDAVVVTDNSALTFISYYRKELFPNTPVVFCGVNNYGPDMVQRSDGEITGVVQDLDPKGTVGLIRKIQPGLKELIIVSGTTPTARAIRAEVASALAALEPQLKLVWFEALETKQLVARLAGLSPDQAVLLCNFNRDAKGGYYSHEESGQMISRASAAPVYAMEDHYMGTGVMGGYMNSSKGQGNVAARLCLEIFETGKIPPVVLECPSLVMIDHKVLVRFGLDEVILPLSAVVLNQPFSLYQAYGKEIWGIGLTMVCLLILVFFLGINVMLRRESEANLHVTLQSIGDGVIATDCDGKITRMNPVAESLTGWNIKEAKGQKVDRVFNIIHSKTREKVVTNPVERVMVTGHIVGLANHTSLVSKTGGEYQISDSGAPIVDKDGKINGVVLVFRDVTEAYQKEAQLRQAQKHEAIGTLAGGIAHDFNNILSGIFGFCQLAQRHVNDPEKTKGYLGHIMESSRRAAELVRQILSFSRQTDQKKYLIPLTPLVTEVLKLLRSSLPATIEIENQFHSTSLVEADPTQIHQVVMNLGTNAYHAMKKAGGRLTILGQDIEVLDSAPTALLEMIPGKYLRLEVTDTGEGMNQEILQKAFDPYFTTREKGQGTGMGLALVRSIVEQHKGYVTVDSTRGQGTSVRVYLPISYGKRIEKKENKDLPLKRGTENIMFVDDEVDICQVTRELLVDYGYKVSVYHDGPDALSAFQREPAAYDMLIADMTMPKMRGAELAQKILGICPHIPVLLCSGYFDDASEQQALKMGIQKCLLKPVSSRYLLTLIRKIFDGKNI
jgi:two-component system cell cycle sensor histidine kinase/response regulator CckA